MTARGPIEDAGQWMRSVNRQLEQFQRHRHAPVDGPDIPAIEAAVAALQADLAATQASLSSTQADLAAALLRIDALEYDTGWTDLVLENGWVVSSFRTPQVRRVNKVVAMRGRVSSGSGGVTTLAAEFRPSPNSVTAIVRDGTSTTDFGVLNVDSAGVVSALLGLALPNLEMMWLVD